MKDLLDKLKKAELRSQPFQEMEWDDYDALVTELQLAHRVLTDARGTMQEYLDQIGEIRQDRDRLKERVESLEELLEVTKTPANYDKNVERLQDEVNRLTRLQDIAAKDIEQLQGEIKVWMSDLHDAERERDNLKELLEPGKCAAIMDGLWREAERLGHPTTSSRHALSFLVEEVESLRRVVVTARTAGSKYRNKLENAMLRIGSGGDDDKVLHTAMVELDDTIKEYEAAQ